MARGGPGASSNPAFGVLEAELFDSGHSLVAGVDEAGRGPLAGPVVAAALALDRDWPDPGVCDSKALSPAKREYLAEKIKQSAPAWAIAQCGPREVERLNIHQASLLAMKRAVIKLSKQPEFILVDGRHTIDSALPQKAVIKGDALCRAVAGASILAKTWRDALMLEAHQEYPVYNFASNKGYPTAEHRRALRVHGPCPLHRKTYGPVAQSGLGFGQPAAKEAQKPNLGREAETLAEGLLRKEGMRLLERNHRNQGGELDIIALDGEVLIFVEVKARSNPAYGGPAEMVGPVKQKRLTAAAAAYLAEMDGPQPVCRFDVVSIDYSGGAPRVEHIKDAFRLEG